MANTKYKYAARLEAIHNQWCVDNGYPVRKRPEFTSGKLTSAQAGNLNAENSERFVKGASRQAHKRTSAQAINCPKER